MTDPAGAPGAVRADGAAILCVRGEAEIEVPPDIVVFSVSVSARARDRREAMADLAQRGEEFLALVRSFGGAVEKVETSGVSVYPEVRRGREERVRWYRGTVRSRVTIADLSITGELVGRMSDLELCVIEGPWWRLRAGSPAYREARGAAARAAITSAAEYAEAIGGRLTGLLELADSGASGIRHPARPPGAFSAKAAGMSPAEPVVIDLEPETQVIRAVVEARFTMTQPGSLRA